MLIPLLSNPWFYLIAIGTGWLARLAIKHVVRATVDHQFALRIEDHKHELQRITEQERFDLQRRLAGASLYLQKQHEVAAKVYVAVRVAHGFIVNLFESTTANRRLEDYNEADLRGIMAKNELLEGKQEELLARWREDRQLGADAIRAYLFELRIPQAEKVLGRAKNSIYLDEIYLSDSTIAELREFVEICHEWLRRAQLPADQGQQSGFPSRDALDDSVKRVHFALRAELSDPPSLFVDRDSSEADADGRLNSGLQR
jgi:hypothetical protein